METWQKIVLGSGIVLVIGFIVWGYFFTPDASTGNSAKAGDYGNPNASVVYYYGDGCPHCADTQEYFDENGIEYGEDFAKKEVWKNKSNNDEMVRRAEECGLDTSRLGVPFLYAEGECFIGQPAVTGYFK